MRYPKQKTRLEEYQIKYVPRSLKPCEWQYDEWHNNWNTGCGEAHVFIADGPRQNGYKYCPYCGGKLEGRNPE